MGDSQRLNLKERKKNRQHVGSLVRRKRREDDDETMKTLKTLKQELELFSFSIRAG
jgi:hypothetical protein